MLDLGTLTVSVSSSAVTAGVMSVLLWYKIGRIEQKLQDLPCSGNGFRYDFLKSSCPTNRNDIAPNVTS